LLHGALLILALLASLSAINKLLFFFVFLYSVAGVSPATFCLARECLFCGLVLSPA
jgi:hypothetical protein